jgi:hypothetical protein
MHKAQRLINHVALVLDGSSSMSGHTSKLIKVADDQIRHLALRSEELSQETRVSVYLFADKVQCLIFDMDVMRLPSIADLYRAMGMTALIDATVKSQEDLATTSQIYGDHAFLTFVLTDGMENASFRRTYDLTNTLRKAEENWTIGFLVPDRNGTAYLTRIGVPDGNIAQWDTASADGIKDAVSTIRSATDSFMSARASGVRGTRNVFSTGTDALNRGTVPTNLSKMKKQAYTLLPVKTKTRIDDFVRANGMSYYAGIGFYQLTKTEDIQPQKDIIVVDRQTKDAYSGPQARALIGLPSDRTVRVRPNHNPQYDVYVQSTSLNRNLVAGTSLLVKK